jgi:ketosteroid isomerase-like protein
MSKELVDTSLRGKARERGIEVQGRYWSICTFRDGMLERVEQLADRARAFRAAGLAEP